MKPVLMTETNFVGMMTAKTKVQGDFPSKDDAYIGLLRFDEKQCGASLLEQIEIGEVPIFVGDMLQEYYELQGRVSFLFFLDDFYA